MNKPTDIPQNPKIAKQRIMVVDDESNITQLITSVLHYEGFAVESADDGHKALSLAEKFKPDMVILDVMLPDLDGFEVYRRLQIISKDLPILFLTAKDSTEDKVKGLTLGADDYVSKPFSLEELVARVRSILRRTHGLNNQHSDDNLISYDDLEIDLAKHSVRRKSRFIELTPTEFNLLHYLTLNAEIVLTKTTIMDRVWDYDFGGEANVVETYISYLRKKVDMEGERPLIHTVRGVGYSLRIPR